MAQDEVLRCPAMQWGFRKRPSSTCIASVDGSRNAYPAVGPDAGRLSLQHQEFKVTFGYRQEFRVSLGYRRPYLQTYGRREKSPFSVVDS